MPVKRYEVDGNPYDVSEAKEQEFLSKFNNAVLIGVLDEDTNEVITQDEPQDFPTSTVEDADAVQQPMTASQAGFTESPSVNTLSDLEDPKPFVINGREVTQQEFEDYKRDTEKKEIYGTYLKEDGTTGYNEKPYSVQLQDYKGSFESILKAEGVYEFLKDYDIEYRQEFAASQLANKVPRYTRQQYNQSTNTYDSIPTEDAEKQFSKNLPSNFDLFDDKKDFNIALDQGIQKTIAENPLINYQIKIASKKAERELKDYALGLREEYDFNTPEGIADAEEAYNNRWKELVIDPVSQSTAYKNTVKDLQLVASNVAEKENINFGRYKSAFLSSIDFLDQYDPTGILSNVVEPLVGTGVQMRGDFNKAAVSAQQVEIQNKYDEITRLKNDVESGKLKEDAKVIYGGSFSQKSNTRVGGKSGTVKDKIKYLEDQINLTHESIAEDIQDVMDSSEYGSLFTQADFSDGVQFKDIVKTISASAPYMAVAAGGAMTGNPVLAGAGFMSMFTMEYGASYMGAIEQGLKNDGLEYNEKNIIEALKEGKYASQAQAAATGVVSASLEQLGATKVAKNTMKALGLGGTLKKSLGSLYKGEVKQFVKSTARGLKQQSIAGIGEAGTELGQNLASQISTGTQLEGLSGIGKYIDTEANREAALGGGLAGFFIPFGASVVRQSVSELRNSARDVATKFDLTSKFGSSLKAANNFFKEAESNLQGKLDNGEITQEEYRNESENLSTIRNSGLKIPKTFSESGKKKAFDLIIEKNNIEQNIANKDPELVKKEKARINEINEELNNVSAKEALLAETVKSEKGAVEILKSVKGANIEFADDQATVNALVDKIREEDGKKPIVNYSDAYGQTITRKDGSQIILINRAEAFKDGVVNTAAHEVLHAALDQTLKSGLSPENQISVSNSLFDFMKTLKVKTDNKFLQARLDQYQAKYQPKIDKLKSISESMQDPKLAKKANDKAMKALGNLREETITLLSEAMLDGDIQYNENLGTKLKDLFRRLFSKFGWKAEFNTGKDVFNFIKDYNRSIKKGKGLSKGLEKSLQEGIKGKLVNSDLKGTGTASDKPSLSLQEQLDDLDLSDFDGDEYALNNAKSNLELKIRKAKQKEISKPSEFKEKVKIDTKKNEKRIGDQLKEMVPTGTTNKEFKEKVAIKVIDNIDRGMLNPLIKKIAAGYGVVADNVYGKSWDDFFIEVGGVQLKKNIMNFNPESNNDLGGYIIGSQYGVRNRVKEALAKFKKEGEGGFKEDVSVAKNIIAREDATPQEAEKRKYTPLTKSNVVPNFTLTGITDKLTTVLSGLTSKMTDKRGDNSSTTPLVAEIKKKIGKVVGDPEAAPKIVIQRLGKLKDGTYEKNLIKNKKAIIENMTTTFLMGKDSGSKVSGGIPQAIEKSVGGKFTGKKVTVNVGGKEIVQEEFAPNFVPYPEWVGQKIDREKTLVRGATAGNEIVRRVSADKVSDSDFVGLFIDEKGKLIRGKREALGKALAEEMAFEIFSREIQNENSEISKAFESNQEALGEILSDNFVNELQRDLDRGTVKYSLKIEDIKNIEKIAIKEGLTSEKIKDIAIANKIPVNIIEGVLEDIIHEGVLQRMQETKASNEGLKYEQALKKVLNKYTSGDIKIKLIKSQKGDIVINANGKDYKVEVKLNDKAQIGSISTGLFQTKNSKISLINSDNLKINNKLSEDNKKEFIDFLSKNKKYLNSLINAVNKANSKSNEKAFINQKGHLELPYKEFWKNIKDEMPGKIAGYVSYEGNQSIVEDFYKGIDLMQIGGYGAFAIGNKSKLSGFYQKLEATTNNVLRPVRSTTTIYMRLFPNFKEIKNPKSNSLATAKGIMTLTKSVRAATELDNMKPSLKLDKSFNKMLERSTGIKANETISKVIARRKGVGKSKFKVFMPSSLDDFKGLTSYTFAGKGKQGEADQKFFQDNLIDPYFKGIRAIEETRQSFKDDFKTLNKQMRPVIKKLGKLVPGTEFTHDQAIRVALWNASGYEIPGLSEIDQKKLVDYVNDNADLSEYARKLQQISKRPKWAKPGDFWDAETILSDLNNLTEKIGRKEFLSEFIENADVIFSEDNLNKVEAGYGKATRDALEDILYRMKNGTNRPSSTTDNTNRFNTWINNSIGAIMFFNRRSALLQTLSTVNFINWSDNNPLKAAIAFANQKQYWSDFATLFNSPKLKQRRSGLKSDVNEAEIARAVKGSKNKAVAALSYLLKIGFTPTQMADSFAIASGGATFYRNRIKSYLKKVNEEGEALYTKEQAEEMAFKDFSQISEETQQSGDPALISSDQASIVGRVLLAFQNTPIQLNRSIKKAALDIKNRRRTPGQTMTQSDFSNLSKIIYYGTVQNIIFSALQNALFALIPGFEDEDDELTEEEQLKKYGKVYSTKQGRIINGMIDTTLKGGFGLPGAFISTIKNAYQEYDKQEKKKFMADHTYTILALANLSPSIGSKLRKVYSGIQTKKFEKDVIEKRDWDITIDGKFNLSPSYKVLGSVTEGITNLPLDRAVTEVNALTEALDYRNTVWQRVALALGWRSWDVGAENEEHELIKTEAKARRKEEGKEKAKATRAENKKEKEREANLKQYQRIMKSREK
jgi:hypothetical protein